MEFVKFFVGDNFDKKEFVDMLKYQMNVRAEEVDGGIILDRDAFNACPKHLMPMLAYANREHINSKVRTRRATVEEWLPVITFRKYSLCIKLSGKLASVMVGDDFPEIRRMMDICSKSEKYTCILDNKTREIIAEVIK